MTRGFVEKFGRRIKRPLSDREIAAVGRVISALPRDARKRKRTLRRALEEARLVEFGLKARK
jgi:hypothetical protein